MILVLFKKFLGRSLSPRSRIQQDSTPEEVVERIQQGDLRLRNQFITDYQPYIAKVTSRFSKRYIDPSKDDEFSIALTAFNEAINQFSPTAGRSFLGFAETVIRRRLIDYVRKEQRFTKLVPYSSFEMEDEEENTVNPVEVHQALEAFERQKDTEERSSEIIDLNRCLQDFEITFADLIKAAPKHTDSREAMLAVGVLLAQDPQLMKALLERRLLPIKELMDRVGCSRKTLERNRKYIISIALIYNGPYPYLRDFLKPALHHPTEKSEIDE
ncbi:RNA polymerase sigma factor SigI [Paenibacillus sp. CC-CFT747]|nr:RNA polymerase sigma factor SigI [Paenibacillus sp. CC-CFT747]